MRYVGLVIAALFLSITGVSSATYYLDAIHGSDATGSGSSGAPWASMTKVFTAVHGGDTVSLRPGNYGSVTFKKNYGIGSDSTGYITYMADPATCTPRPANWYEDSLARPDPTNPQGKVIFTNIFLDYYASDLNLTAKTGTPDGHYLVLQGLNVVGGNITVRSYVSHVIIRDCNVFGNWAEYSTQITGFAINLYQAYDLGSNYRDILVEGCYTTHTQGAVFLLGNFHNVVVRHSHFHYFCSSAFRIENGIMDSVVLEGNHAHHQVARCDVLHSRHVVTAVDAQEPDRIFTIDNTAVSYYDYASVTDAATDSTEVREVAGYNAASHVVTLAAPLSFNVAVGDSVGLWDGTHGSGIAVRADNFTVRGNRIHDCGASRGLYFYDRVYCDVVIENNLFYSTLNQYTVDLHSYMGNGCVVRHNTFAGTKHRNYDANHDASVLYGFALVGAAAAAGTDPSTMIIANNVFVGTATAPAGAFIKNNIVYAGSGFEEDATGPNSGNLVYYNGEAVGSEPHPFHAAGGFFAGGAGFDSGYVVRHANNFNEYFRLAAGAAAIGFADPAYATAADMTGISRGTSPDAGCYEYQATGIGTPVKATRLKTLPAVLPNPLNRNACRMLLTRGVRITTLTGVPVLAADEMRPGIYLATEDDTTRRFVVIE
jgi:hypothetical protein